MSDSKKGSVLELFLFINFLLFMSIINSSVGEMCALDDDEIYNEPNESVGRKLQELQENGWEGNPEELGSYFQGDMILPQSAGRNVRIDEYYHWPDGIVPFVIHGDYNSRELRYIAHAMRYFHDQSCIKFVPKNSSHVNYINIESDCAGCFSRMAGRMGMGNQTVNLQTARSCRPGKSRRAHGCFRTKGTCVHEFMHVLGFEHEQNRYDRDDYIVIIRKNISPRRLHNFKKVSPREFTTVDTAYDYNSIMHYHDKAFAKRPHLITIKAKRKLRRRMGRGDTFTAADRIRLRRTYHCRWTTSSTGYRLPPLRITKRH